MADKLKDRIKNQGVTIAHVARATGVNYFTLIAWLNGRNSPICIGEAMRVVDFLNNNNIKCTISDLYDK